jgi:predicted RNA polymerase sigma factor
VTETAGRQAAEEVVQEALVRAIETWPHRGIPENPAGWLMQVARNRALDHLRREARFHRKLAELAGGPEGRGSRAPGSRPRSRPGELPGAAVASSEPAAPPGASALDLALGPQPDDALHMLLMGCHPLLPPETRVTLTLKTVGGFGVEEIGLAAIARLAELAGHAQLAGYYLLPATRGDLWLKCSDGERAAAAYREALALPCSEPERRFMLARLASCAPAARDSEK